MDPVPGVKLRWGIVLILAFLIGAPIICQAFPALAEDGPRARVDIYDGQAVGMCHRQPDMTERELKQAAQVMRAIVNKKGALSPEEEERLIGARKLSTDRLNCLMGKLMAANDIFGWGDAGAYGVPLTEEEAQIAAKYKKDSLMLKRYLEEVLNIKVEQGSGL